MLTSLWTGVSGMNANGTTLSVIGDNISNMNTVGFKGSRVAFGDVLSQSLSGAGAGSQVGRGVNVSRVSPLYSQGSLQSTESVLDMGIEGDGFFIVSDGSARYYTRAGQFSVDRSGNIVNTDGLVVQGFIADASGNITGSRGDLQITGTQTPSQITANANIAVNFDATENAKVWAFVSPSVTPPDPTQYNKSTTITVYDSQGGAHDVTAHFVKTAANAWTAHYVYKDATNQYVEAGTQNLTFNDGTAPNVGGSLATDNVAALTFTWGGGVIASSISFDYGTGTGDPIPGTGLNGSTQFASPFSVLTLSQDGYAAGSLKSMSLSDTGIISGVFTNGQTRNIGQIALARFVAPTGLTKLGRNLYGESFDSGQPIVGTAQTSGIGRVLGNTLEQSNVDLAQEFVQMISAQRGFQANSRIITTTDELMQEMVNLKR
ncbi:MAG: flagellar hook protein FlgE [Thermodesulfovibrio sp.]|nr:flagellar hook protein FlgE [Thermodesulfovibrio sp.]